jgi:hypothetical protein
MEEVAGRSCTVATAAAGASLLEVVLAALAGPFPCRFHPNQIAATAIMMTTTTTAVRFEIYMDHVPAYAGRHSCEKQKEFLPRCHAGSNLRAATQLQ